jgi:peptidase M48 ste24p
MNVIVILWIGIISTIGYWILRIGSSMKSDKKSGKAQLVIILIGLSLLLVSWLIFPLIRLAISRKREYLADA